MAELFDKDYMKASAKFKEASKEQVEAFKKYKETLTKGPFDKKTMELLLLAAGCAIQCDYCIDSHSQKARAAGATPEELGAIKKEIDSLPENIERPKLDAVETARPAGCEKCHGLGYKGRIGVYEMIRIDDEIEKLIAKSPSEADLKEAAIKQGQITMRQDAILKILAGITDLAEVERVVG